MAIDSANARKKIESIDNLPTLPSVANRIVATANSPKTSATDVGALVARDQALSAKVLKLVNSSFYGFPKQIKTINHAIVVLGFSKVKSVVMTASIFDLTKGRKPENLNIPKLWEHSLGTALAAQAVTRQLNNGLNPDEAFVGGLLHDFGKIIMDLFLTEEYLPVISHAQELNVSLRSAEREILGFDHQDVGGWIAEKWKLPPSLSSAIRNHHTPHTARDEREMAIVVHIGDIISNAFGIGDNGDNTISALNESIVRQCSIDEAFVKEVVPAITEELKRAREFFDIIEK